MEAACMLRPRSEPLPPAAVTPPAPPSGRLGEPGIRVLCPGLADGRADAVSMGGSWGPLGAPN
jgi:hypothetical protein